MKDNKLIREPIKEYKLPLIERLAYWRPVFKWFFWLGLTATIVGPTIYLNYDNLWYYISLLPLLIFFFLSIKSFIQFVCYTIKYKSIIDEEAENDSAYENYMGPPGSGKSFCAKEISYAKSKYSWEELQFEYWLIASKLKDPNYKPTEEEQEIIESYEFNSNSPYIPCLATTIPCYSKLYRRKSHELEIDHLKQEKRLPYRICMFADEIGTFCNFSIQNGVLSNKSNSTDMDDFARFIRHMLEGRLIGTEQDANNIAIFMRRIASDNKRFDRKQWVLKPKFLFWLYMKLKRRFIRRMKMKDARLFAKPMALLKRYIFSCGFFKFTYKSCGNLVTQSKTETIVVQMQKEKSTCFYFPRASELVYDTRAFRKAYKPLDKPIELNGFTAMKLTRPQAQKFLKSSNLIKSNKASRRKNDEETSEVMAF